MKIAALFLGMLFQVIFGTLAAYFLMLIMGALHTQPGLEMIPPVSYFAAFLIILALLVLRWVLTFSLTIKSNHSNGSGYSPRRPKGNSPLGFHYAGATTFSSPPED